MKFYIKNLLRKFAGLLALVILLTPVLSACDSDPDDDDQTDDSTTAEEPDEPDLRPIRVGFIFSGELEGGTVNKIFNEARLQLEKNLDVDTGYIEGVLVSDFSEAVNTFINSDYNVIVSCSNYFTSVCEKAARENSDIKFISFGGDSASHNLSAFRPLLYQAANVVGLAAAINGESSTVGIVADSRMYNCYGVINSYIIGAKMIAQNNFKASVNFASSNSEKDTINAIDDLRNQGVDIIFLYQSTEYGIKYCEENGIRVVAFSYDLPDIASENYVTGFFFNVNSYLTEQVRYAQNERDIEIALAKEANKSDTTTGSDDSDSSDGEDDGDGSSDSESAGATVDSADRFRGSVTNGTLAGGYVRVLQLNSDTDIVIAETKSLTDKLYENVKAYDGVFMGELKDNTGAIQVEKGVILTMAEVLTVDWLEISVAGNVQKFSEPNDSLISSDFVIRGERPKAETTEAPEDSDGDNTEE